MTTLRTMLVATAAGALLVCLPACSRKPAERDQPAAAPGAAQEISTAVDLSDADVRNLVERSFQYVALYNVNTKFAFDRSDPSKMTWNRCIADTALKDHTMTDIARPNNDTLYIACMMDLRKDPLILEVPAFDSDYVSLMATAYDHFVNVPMTSRVGDFRKPENVLFYSARTEGYNGEPVEGIDRIFEMSGDFVSGVFRVMPHANDRARFDRIVAQMQSVKAMTLSEYRGESAKPIDDVDFPAVGRTDLDTFENNLLEVMQFVFNHLTFEPDDPIDQGILAAYAPLGVVPGHVYDPQSAVKIDGARFRGVAEAVQKEMLSRLTDPTLFMDLAPRMLRPKGETDLDALLTVSVIGPIGLPLEEATYPNIPTADGQPMNAMHDYVVRMTREQLPPAKAFWSLTLYDMQKGFFIPNERKKYSVGANAGMKLNADGGIVIYVAAEQPDGVPPENWLPINREDQNLDLILRIYVPDLDKLKTWTPPKAEMLRED